ncbi:RNA-binding protein 34-like isoform X2 [Corticium candelabrum]|uniref:RNA-binding protein 34-like isoform X2 n=1 Tax=Corticium candelabrum TaxID=121492 RepID=UPI002E276174|nr:RNA-binding protein 34-like isoform X2 [Corticium candelabrum]
MALSESALSLPIKSDREDSKSFTSRSYCTAHQKTKHTERDKRTVFVGNLPVATTRRTLKKLFCKYGSIEATRLRGAIAYNPKLTKRASMIRKQFHPDQESVSGYVVFKKESAANDALNSNGDVVGDRHIRVDHANREKGDYKQSVFVGNLPYVVDEEALRQLFGQCGDVRSIRVVRDKKTGVGKGFGYVHYEDKGAASLALKLHGSEFKGRAIRVFKATDTRKRKQGKKKYVHQESLKRMNKLSTKAKTDLKSSRRLAMMRNKKKTQAF